MGGKMLTVGYKATVGTDQRGMSGPQCNGNELNHFLVHTNITCMTAYRSRVYHLRFTVF